VHPAILFECKEKLNYFAAVQPVQFAAAPTAGTVGIDPAVSRVAVKVSVPDELVKVFVVPNLKIFVSPELVPYANEPVAWVESKTYAVPEASTPQPKKTLADGFITSGTLEVGVGIVTLPATLVRHPVATAVAYELTEIPKVRTAASIAIIFFMI
jgi:hypothetical protein